MHLQELTAAGTSTVEESELHVCVLQMKAGQLAVDVFKDRIVGKNLVLMSNHTTGVAYLNQGGIASLDVLWLDQGIVG